MYKQTKLLISALFLGALLFSVNVHAGKSVDWPGFAEGSASLAVIEGKIKSIDLEKMNLTLEGCELLGNKPLMLSKDTSCYIGSEDDNIVSIRGGTLFREEDELELDNLKVGHYIKCNYSIKEGKYWATRIVRIFPHVYHIFLE